MRKKEETAYGVIGLGRFGEALAIMLAQSGKEVIVVDRDESKIKEMRQCQHIDHHERDRDGSAKSDREGVQPGAGSRIGKDRGRGGLSGEGYGAAAWKKTAVKQFY